MFADDSTLLVDGVGGKVLLTTNTTTELTEGTNLYYTDVRADARITNAGSANWNTAFGWGNHASAGYQVASPVITGDITGSVFGDDSTLLVDGVNNVIPKANIEDSANWDTAFGWGNHASAGYHIISDVKENGDESLIKLTNKLDNNKLSLDNILVSQDEIEFASENISNELKQAIQLSHDRVTAYHQKQLPEDLNYKDDLGIELGYIEGPSADVNDDGRIILYTRQAGATNKVVVVDIKGNSVAIDGNMTITGNIPGYINLADLKTEVAASTDFADLKQGLRHYNEIR